jgi:hypothetical protein
MVVAEGRQEPKESVHRNEENYKYHNGEESDDVPVVSLIPRLVAKAISQEGCSILTHHVFDPLYRILETVVRCVLITSTQFHYRIFVSEDKGLVSSLRLESRYVATINC